MASERPYFIWYCNGRRLLLQNGDVRRWIWALGVVPGRGMGDAQPHHPVKHGPLTKGGSVPMCVLLWWASCRTETRLREGVIRARGSLDWDPSGDQ